MNKGDSIRLSFDWNGEYMGTQFALARPVDFSHMGIWSIPGTWEVETAEHRLKVSSSGWVYGVTVRNTSEGAAVFELTGGEVAP